jgi:hypothetical protein
MSGQEPRGLSKLNRTFAQQSPRNEPDPSPSVRDQSHGRLLNGDNEVNFWAPLPGEQTGWKNANARVLKAMDEVKRRARQ